MFQFRQSCKHLLVQAVDAIVAKFEADQRCERLKDPRLQFPEQVVGEIERPESRKPGEREVGEVGYGVVSQVEAGQLLLESEGELGNLGNLVARHVKGDQLLVVKELGGAEDGDGGASQGELLQVGVQLGGHQLRRKL